VVGEDGVAEVGKGAGREWIEARMGGEEMSYVVAECTLRGREVREG
jgi:hypothetical protein